MLRGLKATDPPVLMGELSNSVINVQWRSPILLMTVTRSDPAVSEWFDSNINISTKILSWRFLFSRRWFQTSFLNDGVISIGDVSFFYRLPVPPACIVHRVLSRPSVSDLRKRLHRISTSGSQPAIEQTSPRKATRDVTFRCHPCVKCNI